MNNTPLVIGCIIVTLVLPSTLVAAAANAAPAGAAHGLSAAATPPISAIDMSAAAKAKKKRTSKSKSKGSGHLGHH